MAGICREFIRRHVHISNGHEEAGRNHDQGTKKHHLRRPRTGSGGEFLRASLLSPLYEPCGTF